MDSPIEAMGGAVTVGLIARSLDTPGAGNIDAAAIANAHHRCANCDAALGPGTRFCGFCGQKAHLHRSLLHVGEEFLHGITHFDGKAWQTLPMLLFQPGKLTREYIMGRRSRYIAPVPLFLLVVFLMFFVFSFVSIKNNSVTDAERQMTRAEAKTELIEMEKQLANVDTDLAAAVKAGNGDEVVALKTLRAGMKVGRDRIAARARGEIESPADLPDAMRAAAADENLTVNLGHETLNVQARKALENPDLVFYKIQSKAYKLSFLLVPLSLPWLWLLFAWRRGVHMYDHAVFALYSISFMSLLFIIGSIALTFDILSGAFWSLLFGASFAHMFFQLKGAYALSNFSAGWRTVALSFGAFMTLVAYASLMLILGVID